MGLWVTLTSLKFDDVMCTHLNIISTTLVYLERIRGRDKFVPATA